MYKDITIIFMFILHLSNTNVVPTKKGSITSTFGEIEISNFARCFVTNGNLKHDYTGNPIPGLWFGLIEYECDNVTGSFLSIPTCKNCGIYCNYNELLLSCNQYYKKLCIGILFGIFIGSFTAFLINYLISKYWENLIDYIKYLYQCRRDYLRYNRIKNNCKSNGLFQIVIFKNHVQVSDKYEDKILDKRREYHENIYKQNCTNGHMFHEKNIRQKVTFFGGSNTNKSNIPVENKHVKEVKLTPKTGESVKKPSNNSSINIKKALIVGSLLIDPSLGCSQNLYINSLGKICKYNECNDISTFTFPLMLNEIVCLRDTDDNLFKIRLEESYTRSRYNLLYYTSDYEIMTKSYYSCQGGGNCWTNYCKHGDRGSQFTNSSHQIQGFDCIVDSMSCDTYCFHGITCNYIKWWINNIGSKWSVSKLTSSISEVRLSISYKNMTKSVVLNGNNPSNFIKDRFDIFTDDKLPIYMTNIVSETIYNDPFIITRNNLGYYVDASNINMPTSSRIGEYQMSIDGNSSTIVYDSIKCYSSGCITTCTIPEPMVRRLGKMSLVDNLIFVNDYMIEVKTRVTSYVNLMIGNLNINNLEVIQAKCKIDLALTYSCIGCNEDSYIVLQPYHISTEGLMSYESNCTFDMSYISCTSSLFKLRNIDHNKFCFLYVPSINYSINIIFEEIFLGHLDLSKTIHSIEDTSEIIMRLSSDPTFLSSFISSFSFICISTMVISAIIRITRIYMLSRAANKVADI